MDDVVADFWGMTKDSSGAVREHMMWNEDFFFSLKPIAGSKGAIFELEKMGYDVWIVSQPLAESPESYIDKAKWIQVHFPQLYRKIILTQDKGFIKMDYLIDDNDKWKTKFENNGGTFVHFPYGGFTFSKTKVQPQDPEKSWREIVQFFQKESQKA